MASIFTSTAVVWKYPESVDYAIDSAAIFDALLAVVAFYLMKEEARQLEQAESKSWHTFQLRPRQAVLPHAA